MNAKCVVKHSIIQVHSEHMKKFTLDRRPVHSKDMKKFTLDKRCMNVRNVEKLSSTVKVFKYMKKHTGRKSHKCKECGNFFKWYKRCQSHGRTHTGVKL